MGAQGSPGIGEAGPGTGGSPTAGTARRSGEGVGAARSELLAKRALEPEPRAGQCAQLDGGGRGLSPTASGARREG